MENTTLAIELLFEKVKIYSQTSVELWKFKTIEKSSEIVSDLSVKILIGLVATVGLTFANIAVALYLGEIFEKNSLGFLAVAGFYLVLAVLIFIFRKKLIRFPVQQFVINQFLK